MEDNIKKILLVDGNSIMNRAFYGIPLLTDSKGRYTNAVYGFLNILFKIIDTENPTNIVVAFDLKEKTFRHKIYNEYKGQRKKTPDELNEQLILIKDVLETMNIKIATLVGYEADDILGTLAATSENKGYKTVVLSGDTDLLQLATKNVLVKIPKTSKGSTTVEDYYENDVYEKMGVTPLEYIDVKALMGDKSDNIPGVAGVGKVSATDLIKTYHSVENVYENIENITKKALKEKLINDKEMAFFSKKLVTIVKDAPVDIDIDNTEITDIFNDKSYKMIKELGFKSIFSKFEDVTIENDLNTDYKLIENEEDLKNLIIKANVLKEVSIYLSNNKLAVSLEDGNYILENDYIKDFIEKICDSDINIISTEIKEIIRFIGIKKYLDYAKKRKFFDAKIAAYLIDPTLSDYEYNNLSGRYLDIELESAKELKKNNNEELILIYNSLIALKIKKILIEKLEKTNQDNVYFDYEILLAAALYNLENVGIKTKKEELSTYSKLLEEKITALMESIYKETGEEFNINSPKQLGIILFEKMGLKGGKKTKTGYSTSADILEKLAGEYKVVKDVLEYRQLSKLKSTYADALPLYIKEDGRIYGHFNQTKTATGRISSSEPNLQNIPIRTEIGKRLRKVFVPEDGYIFIDADYSQIELRIMAALSNDELLIDAFNKNIDIHRSTASKIFNTDIDDVTENQRRDAKAVNFGIIYGMSNFGLSQDINITRKEADEYIKQYFKTYPKVKEYLDNAVNQAKEKGYVKTILGRIRPVKELASSNFMQRSFGERVAMNSPIQGSAADIMNIAMINILTEFEEKNLDAKIVLQVHDELLIEVKEEIKDEVKEIVERNMMNAVSLSVPLIVNSSFGHDWLEAH